MVSLPEEQRARAIALLEHVRGEMAAACGEDRELLHRMRRYIAKRLEFDERGDADAQAEVEGPGLEAAEGTLRRLP